MTNPVEQLTTSSDQNLTPPALNVDSQRAELAREFPVGWGGVSEELTRGKEAGHKLVFIVDDYTDYCLWDKFLYDVVPAIGLKPDAESESFQKRWKDLPKGNYTAYNLMHTMATDALYTKAGIIKPSFEQLPAIFVVTIGEDRGQYILKADKEKSTEFLKSALLKDS